MIRNESWAPWNDTTEYQSPKEGRTIIEVLGHNDIPLITEIKWHYDPLTEELSLDQNQQLIDITYNNDLEAICEYIKDIEI